MVTVHVPCWRIEVSYEMDEEGEMGGALQFFTRNHCDTSFAYSLDDHLRHENGQRLLSFDISRHLRRTWWLDVQQRHEDGHWFWLYSDVVAGTPGAYSVTYVYTADISDLIVDLCIPCSRGAHAYCWGMSSLDPVARLANYGLRHWHGGKPVLKWTGRHSEIYGKKNWDWNK